MKTDTIAAIATALNDSGIGIIRISGEDAVNVADKLFRTPGKKRILNSCKTHTIHYGFIVDKEENILDEVMVSVLLAPKSYTKENTVEISCHGGVIMINRILKEVLYAGARLAEPGEFTKRAFLNGRIDLSRAEAVMDVIHAQNEISLQASVEQLKGSVFDTVKELRENILYEIAFIESALDDPEHISLEGYSESLQKKTDGLIKRLDELIRTYDNGRIIKEGIQTVIAGRPNAGKSSFLNLLSGQERAIVTEFAGTTRDTLTEDIRLRGLTLHLVDTAGIRNTEDYVEKIGVKKAKESIKKADLVLYVIDASVPLDENDREIFSLLQNKKYIVLLNKNDLKTVVTKEIIKEIQNDAIIISVSAKEREGIILLEDTIEQMFFHGDIRIKGEVMISSLRHKEALKEAMEALQLVRKSLEDNMPEDFYSIDLMNAYTALGLIIGEEVSDDLIEEIFSKFCMGK